MVAFKLHNGLYLVRRNHKIIFMVISLSYAIQMCINEQFVHLHPVVVYVTISSYYS